MGGELTRLIGFIVLTIAVLVCVFLTNRQKKNALAWFISALVLPATGFALIII
ncbi:hypothetical protein [Clostridium amazonitimonense]|uniref:hypothetical protein n=1 Tax=Clostridium amazonitimonense TaxID=1499689 RepID=UPI000AD54440|nr:hypothetical protein [Clostridium amazonitimonense]